MLKGKSPILVALTLALLAGLVAYSAVKKQMHDARAGWDLVPVVVASQDLPEGAVVSYDNIATRSVPMQFVTSSVVKPDSSSYVVGQRVLVPVQAGDPLLWSQFETTRAAERLSSKIWLGARAVTIEASKVSAVGGWVRPADHVDVIGTFKDPRTNETLAVTLLQNVTVVATGKLTGTTNLNLVPESQRDYNTVSLLVVPEEAELLVLGMELGSLTLTLRNENEMGAIASRDGVNVEGLLSGERRRQMEKKRLDAITIIRGKPSTDRGHP